MHNFTLENIITIKQKLQNIIMANKNTFASNSSRNISKQPKKSNKSTAIQQPFTPIHQKNNLNGRQNKSKSFTLSDQVIKPNIPLAKPEKIKADVKIQKQEKKKADVKIQKQERKKADVKIQNQEKVKLDEMSTKYKQQQNFYSFVTLKKVQKNPNQTPIIVTQNKVDKQFIPIKPSDLKKKQKAVTLNEIVNSKSQKLSLQNKLKDKISDKDNLQIEVENTNEDQKNKKKTIDNDHHNTNSYDRLDQRLKLINKTPKQSPSKSRNKYKLIHQYKTYSPLNKLCQLMRQIKRTKEYYKNQNFRFYS